MEELKIELPIQKIIQNRLNECNFCLIKSKDLNCCPLCNNEILFCEECMDLHLQKHEIKTEKQHEYNELYRITQLNLENKTDLF